MSTLPALPSSPPEPAAPLASPSLPPEKTPWLLGLLDALLSEPLRKASPADLVRHRILAGAACFLFLLNAVVVLWLIEMSQPVTPAVIVSLLYLSVLVLTRQGHTITAPAILLLATMTVGLVGMIYMDPNPRGGTHAVTMLLPALAVYLVGPRLGLLFTLFLCLSLGLGQPLYRVTAGHVLPGPETTKLWFSYGIAGIAFLGAWVLGVLHSTAKDAAQTTLERTLKVLRKRESQLGSVIDSTDDLIVSLDPQGNLLTANAAAMQRYRQLYGRELQPGHDFFVQAPPEVREAWAARITQVLQGRRLRFEEQPMVRTGNEMMDISINPILGEDGQPLGITIFSRDITARKEAESRLGEMHRTLVDVSRQAGMAEIATGVLHNVGNTLNSVNISTGVVLDQLRKSRLSNLAKAAQLMREHASDFPAFFSQDPQGRKLPPYLIALSDELQEERDGVMREMRALGESVEHIKSIVSMQQKHARAGGTVEELAVPQLIDEALRLHAVSFERLGIQIDREYAQVPPILVDRHKLLQILVNLLSNARHALVGSPAPEKHLTIRVLRSPEGNRLRIEVQDNGMGIVPENLPRMFSQGFTTKKDGHGFGLHISALAAEEMQGRLSCGSSGPGQGATFTLELPLSPLELNAPRPSRIEDPGRPA
ncbi:ATP-binding protein [Hyalangium minutum]|uniref:histidine kinase n=1 Tax=Hyalangium minutum TaxID=394096 RepID=A0A085W4P0_9BACT|nr:ATP-binding protein [Hyalangium minutum]KFE62653.1 Sensor histidine kinase [Hyalangium minutum]